MREDNIDNVDCSASIKALGVCDLEIAERILARLCAISDAAKDKKSWQHFAQARLIVSDQVQTMKSNSRFSLVVDEWTTKSV